MKTVNYFYLDRKEVKEGRQGRKEGKEGGGGERERGDSEGGKRATLDFEQKPLKMFITFHRV